MDALNDLATEKALLGLIRQISALDVKEASDLIERHSIEEKHFSSPTHAEVFKASRALLRDGVPVESVALRSRLRDYPGGLPSVLAAGGMDNGGEGSDGLFLVSDDLLPASWPAYATRLKDLALRRQVARELKVSLSKILAGEDAGIALAEISGSLARMVRTQDSVRTLTHFLDEVQDDLKAIQEGAETLVVPTGIAALDEAIAGFPRACLTIIGAETGVGKSAFLATVCNQIASRGTKVGVVSLEDRGTWVGWRLLAHKSGLDQFQLRYRKKSEYQIQDVADGMKKLKAYSDNVLIDDRPALKPEQVVMSFTDMIRNRGVDVCLLDHAGELDLGAISERYDLKIANALSQLRDLAKQQNVPVVVATQVTMPSNLEPGSVPEIRHFKNSRELGNRARLALGLGRAPGSDEMKIRILKATNSPAGRTVVVNFQGAAALLDV